MAAKPKHQQASIPVKSTNPSLFILISAIAIVVSIVYSYKLKWLGDDIFIALRYVQNFLAGNGLVYNKGERVEGFTDFLWIMLISFFSWLKRDPLVTVQVLGILASVGTLTLVSIISFKISKRYEVFLLPFITLALALNYDYNTWATSGLETSLFSFLLCTSFFVFFFTSIAPTKRYLLTGFFLCLALMTRPDTLLIVFLANLLFVCNLFFQKKTLPNISSILLYFNLAFVVIYIPYFMWRYHYYGFIFPNTYYDKLGNESNFSKGFSYLWLYFKPHFISLLAFILPLFIIFPLLKNKFKENLKHFLSDNWNAAYLVAIKIVLLYLVFFVAKVGGDFMYARFIIPIAPFLYFIIFYSVLKLVKPKTVNLALGVLVAASLIETTLRMDVFKKTDANGKEIITWNGDVSDERYVYTSYYPMENEIKMGKALNNCFDGIEARMLIKGGQACMGYFANFSYIQEFHGLTDTLIAHSKIEKRERIGHEKHGTIDYFESKNINFVFPIHARPITKDTFRYANINFSPYQIKTEIITYDVKLIAQLKARLGGDFQYTDFPMYLDYYIANRMPSMTYEKLKADYDNFYLYYFKLNGDKERESKFTTALSNKKV